MISSDQIEDWIHEIEERPASAGVILRSIAARLVELDKWNNELLSDNIELRSGNRVEEYEARVAALEHAAAAAAIAAADKLETPPGE